MNTYGSETIVDSARYQDFHPGTVELTSKEQP